MLRSDSIISLSPFNVKMYVKVWVGGLQIVTKYATPLYA
jgi:hypothetical protein